MKIESEEWIETVKNGCLSFDINVSQNQLLLFQKYCIELIKWNRKTNLTAITSPHEVAVKHIIDSLYPNAAINRSGKIIDLGAGGGFPSIPLKILNPEIEFLMVESSRKKVTFLKHVIRTLKLEKIDAVNMRCEELAELSPHKNSYDIVISRAFTEISRFISLSIPFISKGGKIVAMKGRDIDEEIKNIDNPDIKYSIQKYELPYISDKRSQVIISFL